jgi:hypothetical protein
MRRLIVATALFAVFVVPAHAQRQRNREPTPEEMAEKREKEALDRQYKNALKNLPRPESPKKNDPWASMRAPSEPNR